MQKHADGYYVLKGKLDAVSGGSITNGFGFMNDYIEVDGVRWGDIRSLGHIGSALGDAVGKQVEIHFYDVKNRVILGLQVEGDSRFDTIDPSWIKIQKRVNFLWSKVFPLAIAAITFFIFYAVAMGSDSVVMVFGIYFSLLAFSIWCGDFMTGGRYVRGCLRYIEKFNTVR